MSAFALEDGVVYHAYSAYARGLTASGACTSGWTAHPRPQRDGRLVRRHDEYDKR